MWSRTQHVDKLFIETVFYQVRNVFLPSFMLHSRLDHTTFPGTGDTDVQRMPEDNGPFSRVNLAAGSRSTRYYIPIYIYILYRTCTGIAVHYPFRTLVPALVCRKVGFEISVPFSSRVRAQTDGKYSGGPFRRPCGLN